MARDLVAKAASLLPPNDKARGLLMEALPLMMRQSPVKRADNKSQRLTLAVAVAIWRRFRKNPGASHQEIATALNVNPGRVSEVLTGARFPKARAISLYKFD